MLASGLNLDLVKDPGLSSIELVQTLATSIGTSWTIIAATTLLGVNNELLFRGAMIVISKNVNAASVRASLQPMLCSEHQRTAAQRGDDLHFVECGRSVRETIIAATARLRAVNERCTERR